MSRDCVVARRNIPCGNTIGKSATEDIGSTAPPGNEVPVGKLGCKHMKPVLEQGDTPRDT